MADDTDERAAPSSSQVFGGVPVPSFEQVVVFSLVCSQIFDNPQGVLVGRFTVTECLLLLFALCAAYLLVAEDDVSLTVLGKSAGAFLAAYGVSAFVAAFNAQGAASLRYLATVVSQVGLSAVLLVLWRRNWTGPALMGLALAGLLVAVLNIANSLVPGLSILQTAEIPGRALFSGGVFGDRILSVTGIFGQFGVFVLFGVFVTADYLVKRTSLSMIFRAVAVIAVLGVGIAAIATTQSRASIVAFAVALLVYLSIRAGSYWPLVLGPAALIVLVSGAAVAGELIAVAPATVVGRWTAFVEGWALVFDNPLGLGQGAFMRETGRAVVVHNTFLGAAINTGIVGCLALLGFALLPVGLLFRCRRSATFPTDGLLASYCGAVVLWSLYNALTEYILFIIVPISVGIYYYERDRRKAIFWWGRFHAGKGRSAAGG